jgi:putative phosphoribosyl transferase
MVFQNRMDAGIKLGKLLEKYKDADVVVYALPRGGAVVAAEIATLLHAPLDLIFAHKIGHPLYPEYAVAAISESGHLLATSRELESLGEAWLKQEKALQLKEMKRKRDLYLKGRGKISAKDKIAILVDDGIATGLTMRVGVKELRGEGPKKIIVAVPVSPRGTANLIKAEVDEFVGLEVPNDDYFLGAVGAYYRAFDQVEDDEVIEILDKHKY